MNQKKQTRKRYSEEFKSEALALAGKIGFAAAAKELGLYESQLYSWRSARNNKTAVSDRENTLAAENARLHRQLAEQAEELEILKKAAVHSIGQCNTRYSTCWNRRSCYGTNWQAGLN